MRRLLPLLCGLAFALPATAQEAGDAEALRQAVAAVDEACAADPDAPACALATLEATSLVTTALATIGETRDRAAYGDAMRAHLRARAAPIRAASAFALSQLFPDETDTPDLLALLQEPLPGVRIAALAALRASSDPAARILAERTGEVEGVELTPRRPPYDPAALGVTLPPDATYVEFERDEAEEGALLFTTAETQAAVLQALGAQGGHDPFKGASLPGWLDRSEGGYVVEGLAGRRDSFADMAGIVLEGDPAGETDQTLRIALVYRDLQLGRTGIALLWPPPNEIPRLSGSAAVPAEPLDETPEQVAADALDLPDVATLGIKPDAAADDTAFYLMVRAADGAGGDAYLALFPEGAYRKPVALLLATAMIIEPDATRVPPGATITIRFRNTPGNDRDWFTIMPPDAPDDDRGRVALTRGAKDGSVAIVAPSEPGAYELRMFFDNSTVVERRIPVVVDPEAEIVVADDGTSTTGGTTGGTSTGTVAGTATLSVTGTIMSRTPIVVHYAGMPGAQGDWITIVAEGTADVSWGARTATPGTPEGEVSLPGLPPGRYEVRAYVERPTRAVVARLAIEIRPSVEPQGFAVQGTPAAGAPIVIAFTGMPDVAGNWVSVAPVGTPDTEWGTYVYAPPGSSGTVTLPGQPAGRYIARFFVEKPARAIYARLAFAVQ